MCLMTNTQVHRCTIDAQSLTHAHAHTLKIYFYYYFKKLVYKAYKNRKIIKFALTSKFNFYALSCKKNTND